MSDQGEKPGMRLMTYRGREISVTQAGHFIVGEEDAGFETLHQAREYADSLTQSEAKRADQGMAIKVIRSDGARGTITGVNRTSREPKIQGMPTPFSDSLNRRPNQLFFDHPWVEGTLKRRDQTAEELGKLNRQLQKAQVRISGHGRIEPENYEAAIEKLMQMEQDSREEPGLQCQRRQ